jgi:hypothetical protein
MNPILKRHCYFLAVSLFISAPISASPVSFSATAPNAAGISPVVDVFRATLGTQNPNVAGSFGSGRREINWDGVPDASAAPNNLSANFFNINSPRGVVFSTPGTGFQVSASASSGTPAEFGNLNPSYPGQFSTFSAQRLFTALGSNIVDVSFFIPGTGTEALTNGFGAVFTDVDLPNLSSMEFFDANNVSLYASFVEPSIVANEGLSFLGVVFTEGDVISRVRIRSGNAAAGANDGGGVDIVVMDDFIYGEPGNLRTVSVSEPANISLLGFALLGLVMCRRRRVTWRIFQNR